MRPDLCVAQDLNPGPTHVRPPRQIPLVPGARVVAHRHAHRIDAPRPDLDAPLIERMIDCANSKCVRSGRDVDECEAPETVHAGPELVSGADRRSCLHRDQRCVTVRDGLAAFRSDTVPAIAPRSLFGLAVGTCGTAAVPRAGGTLSHAICDMISTGCCRAQKAETIISASRIAPTSCKSWYLVGGRGAGYAAARRISVECGEGARVEGLPGSAPRFGRRYPRAAPRRGTAQSGSHR